MLRQLDRFCHRAPSVQTYQITAHLNEAGCSAIDLTHRKRWLACFGKIEGAFRATGKQFYKILTGQEFCIKDSDFGGRKSIVETDNLRWLTATLLRCLAGSFDAVDQIPHLRNLFVLSKDNFIRQFFYPRIGNVGAA